MKGNPVRKAVLLLVSYLHALKSISSRQVRTELQALKIVE